MEEISRREFFSKEMLGQLWRKRDSVGSLTETMPKNSAERSQEKKVSQQVDERVVMQGYFSSPLYSYALLSEMPWEMLIEEARQRNIPYEGRAKMEIVKELFLGQDDKEGDRG